MTLRSITIDIKVRYSPIGEKTNEMDKKSETKAASLPRKQNKNISLSDEKFLKKFSA